MASTDDTIEAILARHQDRPGALLPILHALQEAFGHVPPAAIPTVARAINASPAEVLGVISFYPDFRTAPPGRHVLRLCQAEGCRAVGAEALADQARQRLGCSFHETDEAGAVTLEPAYCLGLCANGPALLVDGDQVHGQMTAESLDALLERLRRP